eukprot:1157220-Pelagomonas_calceolata.AAC.10
MVPVTKPVRAREQKHQRKEKKYASQFQLLALRKGPLTSKLARASTPSQHFRHADMNLANPRTSAW